MKKEKSKIKYVDWGEDEKADKIQREIYIENMEFISDLYNRPLRSNEHRTE